MEIQQRYCVHHPDRPAIGICVVTKQAICGECSTRYEGVNYSKEGLRILQEQRRAQEKGVGRISGKAALAVLAPGLLLLVYFYYYALVGLLMSALDWE